MDTDPASAAEHIHRIFAGEPPTFFWAPVGQGPSGGSGCPKVVHEAIAALEDPNSVQAAPLVNVQAWGQALPKCQGEILGRRNAAVHERHIEIQVFVIYMIKNLLAHHHSQDIEIDDHAGARNRPLHCHFVGVRMAVTVGVVAWTVQGRIFRSGQSRVMQSMRSGKFLTVRELEFGVVHGKKKLLVPAFGFDQPSLKEPLLLF